MFNTLKRKFLIINMSLLSFVFIVIFIAIFILTAYIGERQIDYALERVMIAQPKLFHGESRTATSLLVELNNQNEIIVFSSLLTIDEEIIREAVAKAMEQNRASGKIIVGDFKYSFLKRNITFGGIRIAFVDRSLMEENLRNILLIFFIVGVGSLVLLFLISLYLANRAIMPIKEAFEKQEQFVADASHELKTPLAIIRTNLSVITSNPQDTVENQLRWIGFIQSQIERMSNLINDLLSLAKMDSFEQPIIFENLNLSNIMEGVLLSFEAALFENNIVLETEIQKDIYVFGDQDSLERLINILVDNAIKNTPNKGIIYANLIYKRNTIEMEIKNTGEGISPENLDKVFERFYREDSSRTRARGGYGLGLAIAKSIVEKHDGEIYVKSNLGIDTSFIVKLQKDKLSPHR